MRNRSGCPRAPGVALGHPPLHLHGAPDRVDHTRELGQEAVAGVLDDLAPVLRDLRLDQLPEMVPRRSCVPSSSAPIRREYPATSAARIAVRRRTGGMACPAVDWPNQVYPQIRGGPSVRWVGWPLTWSHSRSASYSPPPPPCSGLMSSCVYGGEGAPACPLIPWAHPARAKATKRAASRRRQCINLPSRHWPVPDQPISHKRQAEATASRHHCNPMAERIENIPESPPRLETPMFFTFPRTPAGMPSARPWSSASRSASTTAWCGSPGEYSSAFDTTA